MNKQLLALYGLKWNPFSPELPIEAVHPSAANTLAFRPWTRPVETV